MWSTGTENNTEEKEAFLRLMKELSDSFEPYSLSLSMEIVSNPSVLEQAFDLRQISKYVDFFSLIGWKLSGDNTSTQLGILVPPNGVDDNCTSLVRTLTFFIWYIISFWIVNWSITKWLLQHNCYSDTKHIPLFSQRPFHFHCSIGTFYRDQTNTIIFLILCTKRQKE